MTESRESKQALRRSLLAARQALPKSVWQEKSLRLCQQLQSFSIFTQAKTILAYFSARQEPDLSSLFESNQTWGFPRCVGPDLVWHQWRPADTPPLQLGPYKILEPHADAPMIVPESVDLLLIPALACDRRGYRLGYGGGFYDRLLSTPPWQEKTTIAVMFEFARLETLPVESWDVPVTAVVTETGLFACRS
ncbi:5-formyltetrahydrofolate cyclo-ligase [Leptolyngbya sp. 'hensonii']|uniref:5-formyltetrahydrofolate cyclo-ligase n=1 Tax=Leptolyngbya sp. 'hensonii' TaxID=1922337 RepID=UPI00095010F4|nr:5-formyltetrahydrofolate cyclo-ligase [Leptolyngbya sp. 'hensonii']OLP16220.1 5-formyltetrahydrofolate cyclo-ligase [Leptolyngbya sp. 'hensonii']